MRREGDAQRIPSLDIAPREMRKAPPAIRHVPAIQSACEVGDDEADREKPRVAQNGERVVTETSVGVVESDQQLVRRRSPLAANNGDERVERNASPAGVRERMDLRGEPCRRQTRDAELASTFDLVVAEDGRDHALFESKLRTASCNRTLRAGRERCVRGLTPYLSFLTLNLLHITITVHDVLPGAWNSAGVLAPLYTSIAATSCGGMRRSMSPAKSDWYGAPSTT